MPLLLSVRKTLTEYDAPYRDPVPPDLPSRIGADGIHLVGVLRDDPVMMSAT
ncbi:hypothetical protein ACFXNW_19525 [Nocardia sp. NPDC059180]|uniref:hypothetical protein n=1 Tax=Nocardia sp. NPDC059180 TaxID=3346761 RepID=UPI0036C4E64A